MFLTKTLLFIPMTPGAKTCAPLSTAQPQRDPTMTSLPWGLTPSWLPRDSMMRTSSRTGWGKTLGLDALPRYCWNNYFEKRFGVGCVLFTFSRCFSTDFTIWSLSWFAVLSLRTEHLGGVESHFARASGVEPAREASLRDEINFESVIFFLVPSTSFLPFSGCCERQSLGRCPCFFWRTERKSNA